MANIPRSPITSIPGNLAYLRVSPDHERQDASRGRWLSKSRRMLDRPLNSGSRPNLATTIAWLLLPALMIPIGLGSSAQAQIPCRYEVTHIIQGPVSPTWGAPYTAGTSISPSGRFVCGYYTYIGSFFAFVYDTTTNQFRTLPYDASPFTMAKDVNDEYVVGTVGLPSGNRGFIYNIATGQSVLLAGVLPQVGYGASISAINASNVVCGTRTIGGPPNYLTSAFIWTAKNGFTDLGLINGASTSAADINDRYVVAATTVVESQVHPVLWKGNETVDLGTLFGFETLPHALNNNNQVAGQSALTAAAISAHAFLWSQGTMADLGTLFEYVSSRALGIAQDGTTVGDSFPQQSNNRRAVIWTSEGVRDLNLLLTPSTNIFLDAAFGLDNSGNIIAGGFDASGHGVGVLLRPIHSLDADVTHDCLVNVSDLLLVINEWHKTKSSADINHDGIVDLFDLLEVIREWSIN